MHGINLPHLNDVDTIKLLTRREHDSMVKYHVVDPQCIGRHKREQNIYCPMPLFSTYLVIAFVSTGRVAVCFQEEQMMLT
jgi:hypothetical protein